MAGLSARTLDALARAISERLRAVVPEGAYPTIPTANEVLLYDRANEPGGLEDKLVDPCQMILSDVQDQIIRDLKEGWPRSVDAKPGERDPARDLPEGEAAVVSGTLRLWYGNVHRPALELPPIDLADLGEDGSGSDR